MTTSSAEAQVIPLRAPGREKPADAASRPGETPADAPVVAFPAKSAAPEEVPTPAADPDPVSRLLGFLRHRLTGDYDVDEFGFDRELTETLVLPPLRVLYEKYFRVTAHGVANLPAEGGGLIVCNHSGTLPLDAVMTAVAVHDETPDRRHLRMLGADLVFQTPLLGALARKTGQTLACAADAERLLRSGELVGVWPEGFKGIGKPFGSRYRLQRFGRGGFVSAALRTRVPIIPCSIVGAEEIYPKIGDLKPLARLLGLPYFPVTPFFPLLGPLGAIPLPTKWHIEFGEPITTDSYSDDDLDDPMLVFSLTDQVRESIQTALYRRLAHRRSPFRD
ncbi:lysophospholipid acyltransferase family protein [Amycolatopsis endophytica]|uniref:1-acyl-sn-glycerol-3-phosphate acyltransferase n=1 Tax=Amycolatopsis endophytica TaxID=860233 RepID=A0A853AZH5_9PSEU|nr:lysophospholipid acyltransferase family protein [Amycolatopsis endophytica]NYI88015.1 1-acyl-sn-glycerol-3-phosphate acyltransferase [Amycolatopsis endophytica]